MEPIKDGTSEFGESEDLPSDFFDDFTKDEFMEGLSVIDECWEDASAPQKRDSRTRISEALDSVKDLRELIGENNEDESVNRKPKKKSSYPAATAQVQHNSKYRWRKPDCPPSPKAYFGKPGTRRDPSKTNEAIKKDKEIKVQQFLAKTLESSDDLRPPGTELDDYYEDDKIKKESSHSERNVSYQEPVPPMKESPQRFRHSPRQRLDRHSPRQRSPHVRHSPRPRFSPRGSPRRGIRNQSPTFRHRYPPRKFSPHKNFRRNFSPQRPSQGKHIPPRRSPARHSPPRRSQGRHSPPRRSQGRHSPPRRSPGRQSPPRRSPRRFSPGRRSPRRQHRSRSPCMRLSRRSRSRSRSPRSRSVRRDDSFLYPNSTDAYTGSSYQPELGQQYAAPIIQHAEYPGNIPGYQYPQVSAYGPGFSDPYSYGQGSAATVSATGLMTNVNPVPAPNMLNPVTAPPMVPAPSELTADKSTPYDALAQLVAEGKISQEDYLKLTPNKGQASTMDTKTRVVVLTRCNQALTKLDKLLLPNRLILNTQMLSAEDRYLAPKFCSPLKRQIATEFSFTIGSVSPAQQTKQLVESIISTLGLDKVVTKYKRKMPKDMKDAVIQTTKATCEVCEIRESIKYHDVGTSTEPEYFTSTVHTQVVEQDLVSSKSIFNPSGSVGEGAAMSIAHLTPAQLVSQLAARAKTLKQPQDSPPPQNQFNRRPPPNYDYDGRGGQQYHHSYNNYRY